MLDAFIIEEIIRREERQKRSRPALHAPSRSPYELPPEHQMPDNGDRDEHDDDDEHDGVIIIDM